MPEPTPHLEPSGPRAGAAAPGVRLHDHTTLEALGGGRYRRTADRTWWGHGSLFGGYALALVATAMQAEVGVDRTVRALTMHFLRPLLDGELGVEVAVERAGRTVSTLSARVTSGDRLCGLAIATCAVERSAPPFEGAPFPDVPPVGEGEDPELPRAKVPTQDHFRFWPRFSTGHAGDVAVTGGWVVPMLGEPWSAGLLLAVGDLWLPAVYEHLDRPGMAMSSDFTGHIRVPDPAQAVPTGTPVLARLRTRRSAHGFVDEDTDIWAPSGELVASTRQLRFISEA